MWSLAWLIASTWEWVGSSDLRRTFACEESEALGMLGGFFPLRWRALGNHEALWGDVYIKSQ